MPARHRALALVLLGSLLVTGCRSVEPTATSVPATATRVALAATDTPLPPTATPMPPTATAIPPSLTQTQIPPTATPLPTNTSLPSTTTPQPTATPRPPLSGSGGGVIAFVSNWDILLMNEDGTDVRRLTTHRSRDAWPTWSPDGKQIAFMSERNGRWNVFVMDVAQGESSVRRLTSSNMTWEPAWSPDGAWLAFGSLRGANSDIYLMDMSASGSPARRLTDHRDVDGYPCWSPDSSQIAFVSDRDGNSEIYVMNADGSDVRRLTDHDADDWDPDWSPDGSRIAFASRRDGNMEIYVVDADGGDLRRMTDHPADDLNPSWSPDGTRIAFHREEGGNADLYVVNADGGDPRKLTGRPDDGSNPVWRPEPVALLAYVPLYEPAACQFPEPSGYEIECGYLTVPEDRSQVTGRQIRLHTAIVKSASANPEPDPVVHLVGGPGGSLLDDIVPYLGRGGDEILKKRDYVLFNQRGTHYAEPFLACPGRTEIEWELAEQGLTLEERNRRQVEFLLDCHDDLIDQGINLSAYNSAENAADVNDLRIALGYGQTNLYGVSYGSRLALTTMRDHPTGIRSAIIDAVLPLQANLNQEITLNAHRAFHAVFEDCAADADCSQAHPDLETTFYRVVDELNTHPVSLQLSRGLVVVDGYAFVDALFGLLYSTDAIPWIPFLIEEASHGEYPELSIFAVPGRSTRGWGMHYSIWCREEVPFESQEEALVLAADLPPLYSDLFATAFDWTVCESWKAGVADPIENQAVVSDIPTLVLSGRYDPVTPPAWGRLAAETLANSFVYEFPSLAHGAMRSNACALEIGLQFLDDPTAAPDASCLDELVGPEFR
jgi:pimeloyl-ACP methyl ester carboxylesterase